MSDEVVNKGKTYRLSFEDFVLLPLFAVLIFLSLRICFFKVKRRIKSHEEGKCPNKNCIRCRGHGNKEILLGKLNAFKELKSLGEEVLKKIRDSIEKSTDRKILSIRPLQMPTVLYIQDLQPMTPFHALNNELTVFMDKSCLRSVKKELNEILKQEYLWSYNEVRSGSWRLYYFYNQGNMQNDNCSRCPETTKMISNLTSFMENSPFGNAAFSVLSPGTSIKPHYGATNARLRCHVTLKEGACCNLFVGNEKLVYKEDKILLFDDSFIHSVEHESYGEDRIVLLIDLWHPNLTSQEKEAINYIYS